MKTVTITLHDTVNCGSSLQAFALQHYLKQIGVENELIDYVPAYTQHFGHPIRSFIRKTVYFRFAFIRRMKFHKFICKYLSLTKHKYKTPQQLMEHPPAADCYITGSDQLWNTMFACGRDSAFYLDFAKGKKIAYAVSLGREVIPKENLDMVKKYISDFSAISVREKSSVTQLGDLCGKNIAYVCDPVLLNSISEYDEIRDKRLIFEPYILVYMAQGIEPYVLNKWIDEINGEKKRSVVFIGANRKKCICNYHIRDYSPGEFLSLISYADYVISNSFHATLFSLMYQKQFVTVVPKENGARMECILQDVGLENHAVTGESALPDEINRDYYKKVEDILDIFRTRSQKWLKEAIFNQE